MKSVDLKNFSVDDLLTLRDRVNGMLESRVERERRDLEARLKRLQGFKAAAEPQKERSIRAGVRKRAGKASAKPAKKLPPKYRNPENADETWSGRGLQPRWM